MTQIRFRLNAVEFATAYQRVHQRRSFATTIRAHEQVVFSPQTHYPQRIFRDIIVDFRPAIGAVVTQRLPVVHQIVERLRRIGLSR